MLTNEAAKLVNEVYPNKKLEEALKNYEVLKEELRVKQREELQTTYDEAKSIAQLNWERYLILVEKDILFAGGRFKLTTNGEILSKSKGWKPMIKYLDVEKEEFYIAATINGEAKYFYMSDIIEIPEGF